MYLIRSRRIDWQEVPADTARIYAKILITELGYGVPRDCQKKYLKRFVKGVELSEVIEEE